jgi:hypothetical protein
VVTLVNEAESGTVCASLMVVEQRGVCGTARVSSILSSQHFYSQNFVFGQRFSRSGNGSWQIGSLSFVGGAQLSVGGQLVPRLPPAGGDVVALGGAIGVNGSLQAESEN